jgi:hypothetical protein
VPDSLELLSQAFANSQLFSAFVEGAISTKRWADGVDERAGRSRDRIHRTRRGISQVASKAVCADWDKAKDAASCTARKKEWLAKDN